MKENFSGKLVEARRSSEKLVRSRLKWTGHVERTEKGQLTKRAVALRVDGTEGEDRDRVNCVK